MQQHVLQCFSGLWHSRLLLFSATYCDRRTRRFSVRLLRQGFDDEPSDNKCREPYSYNCKKSFRRAHSRSGRCKICDHLRLTGSPHNSEYPWVDFGSSEGVAVTEDNICVSISLIFACSCTSSKQKVSRRAPNEPIWRCHLQAHTSAEWKRRARFLCLDRNSRGVRPTPAGEALLHHAHIGQIEQMRGDLHLYAEGLRGHIRLLSVTAGKPICPRDYNASSSLIRPSTSILRRCLARRSSQPLLGVSLILV